jgi:hypothetical protein
VRPRKKPGLGRARVGAALRMAALALRRSPTALGAYSRRIAQRAGPTSPSSPPPGHSRSTCTASCAGGNPTRTRALRPTTPVTAPSVSTD